MTPIGAASKVPRSAFVCQVCMTPVSHADGRYEKRIEYVRADRQRRIHIIVVAILCRLHADEDAVYERAGVGQVTANQWEQIGMDV